MAFLVVQVVYWLALSTWFGGVLFIAIAAPIILRTVAESNPILPSVLSVNLEGQHGTLLAGTIIGNLLSLLTKIQLGCAGVLLAALVGQWVIVPLAGWSLISAFLRSALFAAAVIVLVYDWRVLSPRVWKYRQEYIDHADEPDVANPARDQFERHSQETVTLLMVLFALLLGMVLFSGGLAPPTELGPTQSHAAGNVER
jgi:hypothetical protein